MSGLTITRAELERGFRLYAEAFAAAYAPPTRMRVSEWAATHRRLSSLASAEAVRYDPSRTPYMIEIMDSMAPDDPTQQVALMKGGQLGGTDGGIYNCIGYMIDQCPGPAIMVEPTVDDAKAENLQRLQPMIDDTPVLDAKCVRATHSKSGSTKLTKVYLGGMLRLTGANSARGLRRMPARFLYVDEVDAYPGDVEGEGDPVSLLLVRSSTFRNRKALFVSTPKIKGRSRIEKLYMASDQRRYFVVCPHCGDLDYLRWERIKWDPGKPETAHCLCMKNGCIIEHHYKTWMMDPANGACWKPTATPEQIERARIARIRGYQISALYSPIGWKSWAHCAAEWLEKKDDPTLLKTFINTVLGETWDERPGDVEPDSLLARKEKYGAAVPDGVGVLVCTVDTQDDGLVWMVTGWGYAEESWVIDYGKIDGDPSSSKVWRELDEVRERRYLHVSGQEIPIEITTVDAGGHHWSEVIAYTKPRINRRVYAVFGTRSYGKDLVGKPSTKNKQHAKTFPLCVNTGKDTVWGRLKILKPNAKPPSPGYIHLPDLKWVDHEFVEQMTAEYPEAAYVRGVGWTHKWDKIRTRNEVWDLTVYALAALQILGDRVIHNLSIRAAAFSARVDGSKKPVAASPRPPAPPVRPAPLRRRFVTAGGRLRR